MNVLTPTTLSEACDMLAAHGGRAVPIAGATDLLVHWLLRQSEHDKTYLDLSGIAGARAIQWKGSALTLGPLTTYWDVLRDPRIVEELPLLTDAARQIGAVQIQSRGTWAGNIANGSPAADGVLALMAYDAAVQLTSTRGVRLVPLYSYYTGYRASVRQPDELITSIIVLNAPHDISFFHKVGPRRAQAITKVGLAVARQAHGAGGGWRVVANSVAPTVRRCENIEELLTSGKRVSSPTDFLPAANLDIAPIDDIRSTAEYRRTVLCRLLYHSLRGQPTTSVV